MKNKVIEFNNTFGLEVNNKPTLGTYEDSRLRYDLMEEELDEYWKAVNVGHKVNENKGLVEIADALTDELYILIGKFIYHGMSDKIEELFNAVHASNMSKVCNTLEEAKESVEAYSTKGIHTTIQERNSKYVLLRNDGKVLKSINFFEPKLKEVLCL